MQYPTLGRLTVTHQNLRSQLECIRKGNRDFHVVYIVVTYKHTSRILYVRYTFGNILDKFVLPNSTTKNLTGKQSLLCRGRHYKTINQIIFIVLLDIITTGTD